MFLWKLVNITLFIQFYWKKGKGCKLRFIYSCHPEIAIKTPLPDQTPVTSQQLVHNLSAWGFELCEVNGDGNCLFTLVALALANDEEILYWLYWLY